MIKNHIYILIICISLNYVNASNIIDAIQGAKIEGLITGNLNNISGRDVFNVRNYEFDFKTDVTTAPISGFSTTIGVSFSHGKILNGYYNDNGNTSIAGSRIFNKREISDEFGISQFYVSKEFADGIHSSNDDASSFKLDIGAMNLDMLTSTSYDRGVGARLNVGSVHSKFYMGYYDSWNGNAIYKDLLVRNIKTPSNIGIGNNLFVTGLKYNLIFKSRSNIKSQFEFINISDLIDYGIYSQLEYNLSKSSSILTQFANIKMNKNARLIGDNSFQKINREFSTINTTFNARNENHNLEIKQADLRGIYNIQLKLFYNHIFSLRMKTGYAGTFGNGYGVALSSNWLDVGGEIWNEILSFNGIGIFGNGSINKHNINLYYVNFKLNPYLKNNIFIGFDFLRINNNNTLMPLKASSNKNRSFSYNKSTMGENSLYKNNKFAKTIYYEFTTSIIYSPNKNVNLILYYGKITGDLNLDKIKMKFSYSF